jgi:hypothetical protein
LARHGIDLLGLLSPGRLDRVTGAVSLLESLPPVQRGLHRLFGRPAAYLLLRLLDVLAGLFTGSAFRLALDGVEILLLLSGRAPG